MQQQKNVRGCFLRHTLKALLGIGAVLFPLSITLAQDTPMGPKWWPSEWGPDDQRGAMNCITPQKILQAASLIKEGKLYQLGRVCEHTRSGVYNHENLDLSALAKDKVYEFVYVFAPLRLKGATGSPGNPFAIR
jgi:hypothetical protein